MRTLIQYAVDGGADAVQLACSMYGPITTQVTQPRYRARRPTRRCSTGSRSLRPTRVGVLASLHSAAQDSEQRLRHALRAGWADAASSGRRRGWRRGGRSRDDIDTLADLMAQAAAGLDDWWTPSCLRSTRLRRRHALRRRHRAIRGHPPHLAASTLAARIAEPGLRMIGVGCIADDFTGGTDVAAALRRAGLSVTLLFDLPDEATDGSGTDAVVIALKTRTVPATEAVRHSLAALAWLEAQRVDKVYFKYCSTFDSTDEGNIGPVTDALLDALGESMTIICPASPEHGRTMYQRPPLRRRPALVESCMRHHPLTPMTDPDMRRVLSRQTTGAVGHLPSQVVREGADRVASALKEL